MASRALKLITLATVSTAFECTRSHLENVATQYIGMMATGQHDLFENLAYTMQYVENNKTSTILNGTPAFGMTMDSNRSMFDTVQCKTFTEIIVTDPKHPYVIHTQMTLDNEGNVVLIDSLVTDKGDCTSIFSTACAMTTDPPAQGPSTQQATDTGIVKKIGIRFQRICASPGRPSKLPVTPMQTAATMPRFRCRSAHPALVLKAAHTPDVATYLQIHATSADYLSTYRW